MRALGTAVGGRERLWLDLLRGEDTLPALKRIVIVGGALSGSALSIHLLARDTPLELTVIERTDLIGKGPAFGTTDPTHRLNVPANQMSLDPTRPLDFLEWMRKQVAHVEGTDRVQRMYFGEYVEARLKEAVARSRSTFAVRRAEVVAADAHGVTLSEGSRLPVDVVVLATGNQPPSAPSAISAELLQSPRVLGDPWRDGVLDRIEPHEALLVVGTGLTAVDALLSLASRGHTGRTLAISRRGLLPRAHLDPDDPRNRSITIDAASLPRRTLELARFIRAEVRRRDAEQIGWQCVMDALRPHTQRLWAELPLAERAVFVRKLRPYWDVLRHRSSKEALAQIEARRRDGFVEITSARLERVTNTLDAVLVTPSGRIERRFDRILLCTGPEADVRRWKDPLYRQLLGDGHLASDPLGLGIVTDDAGCVIDREGRPSSWLYTMGSLRRARLWETIAVPDLVPQAVALSRIL